MRPLDATRHAIACSLLKPHHRFLGVSQGTGIVAAGVWSRLEPEQSIFDDGEECFIADSVDTRFLDGSVLEFDALCIRECISKVVNASRSINLVDMASIAMPRFVKHLNFQGFIESIDFMASEFPWHFCGFFH